MKKILFALFLIPLIAFAAPLDLMINQRSADNLSNPTRTMTHPPTGDAVLLYDGSTNLPILAPVGSNLTVVSGVIDGIPQVQTDWNATTGLGALLNKPSFASVATTGAYADLIGAPTVSSVGASGQYSDLIGAPTNVSSFTNDASYATTTALSSGLSGKETAGAAATVQAFAIQRANHTGSQSISTVTGLQTAIDGKEVAGAASTAQTFSVQRANHTGTQAISTVSGLQSALDGKYAIPTGSTAQYLRGDGSLATLPAAGTGTVTSVVAGTGLSGGTISTTGTISLPNTGTSGTYSSVTTDTQGRVTAGTNATINDAPGRTLVAATSSTGFQVSSTRPSRVCYEGSFSTTSSIGGPSGASVFLETADTNSTTPGDWTTKARQAYSNNITLALTLNQVQANNWSFCRDIPAAKYVRIRSGNITGTASVSINTEQQETTY